MSARWRHLVRRWHIDVRGHYGNFAFGVWHCSCGASQTWQVPR